LNGAAVRIAGWLAVGLSSAVALGALLPLAPWPLDLSPDNCFGATLHQAAAGRLSDGPRPISTYGPLGFVFYPLYLPATFAWLFGLRLALAAVTCWGLAWIGLASTRSPWGAALALAATAPFLAITDAWFLLVPLLVLLIELVPGGRAPRALRFALGAASGLLGVVKVTCFLAALVALVPPAAVEVAGRRRVPLAALAAALAGAVAWIATGAGWSDWIAWLDWSLREVAPGYSRAMQHHSPVALVLHGAATSLAAAVAGALLARSRLGRAGWATATGLAGVLFLTFKAGFVRADDHVFLTAAALLVLGTLLALLLGPSPRRVLGASLVALLLGGGLWWHAALVHRERSLLFRPVLPLEALGRLASAPELLPGGAVAREQERRLEEIRRQVPIEPVPGAVDVFSFAQNLALAHGLELRARPVFQSYIAYTPRLARANAEFLRGPRAPRWILFQVAPIDERYPAMDDAASWPVLLTSYRIAGAAAAFALLERRPAPLAWSTEPIRALRTSTGTAVPVPPADAGPIWVEIEIEETLADRLATALFAAPIAVMEVALQDGSLRKYRLIPPLARDGFLLSPLVTGTKDFLRLLSRSPDLARGQSIREIALHLVSPLGAPAGPRSVEVRFSRVHVGKDE
jgi:hypothetical protein